MKSASMARRQSAALRPRRFDGDRGAQRRSGQAGDGRSRRIDFPGSERRGRPPAGGRGALFFCGRRPYLDVMATQLSPDIVLSPAAAARVRWIAERKAGALPALRSEEHTSELQSLMRISYAVFCLKKKISTI